MSPTAGFAFGTRRGRRARCRRPRASGPCSPTGPAEARAADPGIARGLEDLPAPCSTTAVPVSTGAMSWKVVCTVTRARPGLTVTATTRVLAARAASRRSASRASCEAQAVRMGRPRGSAAPPRAASARRAARTRADSRRRPARARTSERHAGGVVGSRRPRRRGTERRGEPHGQQGEQPGAQHGADDRG